MAPGSAQARLYPTLHKMEGEGMLSWRAELTEYQLRPLCATPSNGRWAIEEAKAHLRGLAGMLGGQRQ